MPDIIVYSFSVAGCFFLGLLALGYIPDNRPGNRWFGVFLLSLGFALLSKAVWMENLHGRYPHIVPIAELSSFAIAPGFYLGVWYYTHPTERNRSLWLHFLPVAVFVAVISLPHFLALPSPLEALGEPVRKVLGGVMKAIIPIQVIGYWVFSLALLKRHQAHVELYAAERSERDLSWLRGLLFGILALIVLYILDLAGMTLLDRVRAYLYLAFVLVIGYKLLTQRAVFLETAQENRELGQLVMQADAGGAETTSRLNDAELGRYRRKLDALLAEEELFADPQINLARLAERVGLSLNDLSFLINREYGMNFYALINGHRIEKVKRLLADGNHRHLTILGIAYEAGFTSKSTFNEVFKKVTGMTPTAYLRQHP